MAKEKKDQLDLSLLRRKWESAFEENNEVAHALLSGLIDEFCKKKLINKRILDFLCNSGENCYEKWVTVYEFIKRNQKKIKKLGETK